MFGDWYGWDWETLLNTPYWRLKELTVMIEERQGSEDKIISKHELCGLRNLARLFKKS